MGKGRMMRKGLRRSLQVYLAKMRKAMNVDPRRHPVPTHPSASWILSSCRHPRTLSFAVDRRPEPTPADSSGSGTGPAATLADVDRFLLENFNSLYADCVGDDEGGGGGGGGSTEPSGAPALRRFFVSPGTSAASPGPEEARRSADDSGTSTFSDSSGSSSSSTAAVVPLPLPPGYGEKTPRPAGSRRSVAVMTFSNNPYQDFRRSMQEMVDARHSDPREPLDWEFMEELLISYLELNERCVHKHILGAFTDISVAFRRRRATAGGRREDRGKFDP